MTDPTFNAEDPRQVAFLLVFLELHPDRIADALTHHMDVEPDAARELVRQALVARIDNLDRVEADAEARAYALASEWDLDVTMHGGGA